MNADDHTSYNGLSRNCSDFNTIASQLNMYNYPINILSNTAFNFFTGEIYLVESRIELNKKDEFYSNYAVYLNYSFGEAKKIVPFFDSLGVGNQKRIVKYIQEIYGYKIGIDDAFGKLIVVLFFNVELYDLIIVGLVGLGENSINALIEMGRKLIFNNKSKTIILTKTSPRLSESVCVSIAK